MPAGRPKKTLEDLPKNWKEKTIELASEGCSDVEIRVELNCISDDLWQRLIKENEEFSLTVKKAHSLCQAWWEKQGRVNLKTKDFQTGLWYANMKNRFGWRDKNETEHSVDSELKDLLLAVSKNGHTKPKNG